jgi:hypothetical protein
MSAAFARYIGIDYSGAETCESSLKGLRVYMADQVSEPQTPDSSVAEGIAFVSVPASDPLGRDLGGMDSRRILRCSRLTPVAPAC